MKAKTFLFFIAVACLQWPVVAPAATDTLKRAVIANYAAIAAATYQDSLVSAKKLQAAVEALLAKPSGESLAAARQAWLSAHRSYSLTETFRFYNGPIDEVEPLVNSWPIDASYIDAVTDAPEAGIVNAVAEHPAISRDLLVSLNAKDGKQNISTGFHAIEFLLWGLPPGGQGAGIRPARDYESGAKNVERRREYLRIAAALLVENLQTVVSAWASEGRGNFRAKFAAMEPDAALADILMGMGALSGPEMSGERLTTAYETKERGEQQSCFSNSSCDDLIHDATGIQNVFLGRYSSASGEKIEGPGVFELLKQADAAFAGQLAAQVSNAVAAVQKIPAPFDQAIIGTNAAPNRVAVKKAITALQVQSDMIAQAARVLSIKMNL